MNKGQATKIAKGFIRYTDAVNDAEDLRKAYLKLIPIAERSPKNMEVFWTCWVYPVVLEEWRRRAKDPRCKKVNSKNINWCVGQQHRYWMAQAHHSKAPAAKKKNNRTDKSEFTIGLEPSVMLVMPIDRDQWKQAIHCLKTRGVSKATIVEIVEEVYGR